MTGDFGESVLVYDVGGSHVSAAVCHREEGIYQLGLVASTEQRDEQSSDDFIDLLYSLGVQASGNPGNCSGAELAMPGPFDLEMGVSWMRHKLPNLYGVELRQPLAERFGWQMAQVGFLHDAAAFLLGEIGAGEARGSPRAVGITLGTGIGSALAVNGSVITEGVGVPPGGEIWNLPYADGIVEDSLSTRAIRGSYHRRTGLTRDVAEIAANAPDDPHAMEVFSEFGHHLGQVLWKLFAPFSPDVVVLGGGISRSAHLFLPAARKALQDTDFQLCVSALSDNAPLVGAAVAWFNSPNGSSAHSEYHIH
jgi:predicted NBD/HSP70 family sugar kinase